MDLKFEKDLNYSVSIMSFLYYVYETYILLLALFAQSTESIYIALGSCWQLNEWPVSMNEASDTDATETYFMAIILYYYYYITERVSWLIAYSGEPERTNEVTW